MPLRRLLAGSSIALGVIMLLGACTSSSLPSPMAQTSPLVVATPALTQDTQDTQDTQTESGTSPFASPLLPQTAANRPCSIEAEDRADVAELLETLALDENTFFYWYCAGAGLGDIRQAYSVHAQTGRPIAEIFALFFSGEGWGDIARPTAVPRPLDPDAPIQANTEVNKTEVNEECLAEHANHQQAVRLAKELEITTKEVVAWFCRDIGFGEIRIGYILQHETGVPIEEIMARFTSGKSWGEIYAELGAELGTDPTGND